MSPTSINASVLHGVLNASCPSSVQYDKLVRSHRRQIQRRFKRPFSERIFRHLIFAVFPRPGLLRISVFPLWIYQRSGLQSLLRRSKVLKRMPARLRSMESLAPPVTLRTFFASKNVPTCSTSPRLKVGMLLGCVQSVFFDDVNQATMRVLAAEGCQIVNPARQGCCGALMTHTGEEAMAKEFARKMIDAFESAAVDVIAINAAGCGSAMKEYGYLLRDDPQYASRAAALADKCRDISEILAGFQPRAPRHPLPMRVAYHDACHLQHAQRITSQPRRLLETIPGLQILELEDPAICCGSAGIYNLVQPQGRCRVRETKSTKHSRSQAPRWSCREIRDARCKFAAAMAALGRTMPVAFIGSSFSTLQFEA